MNGEREPPEGSAEEQEGKGSNRVRARGACGPGSPLFLDLAHFSMFVDSYPETLPSPPRRPLGFFLESSSRDSSTSDALATFCSDSSFHARCYREGRRHRRGFRACLGASENRESQGSSGQAAGSPRTPLLRSPSRPSCRLQ